MKLTLAPIKIYYVIFLSPFSLIFLRHVKAFISTVRKKYHIVYIKIFFFILCIIFPLSLVIHSHINVRTHKYNVLSKFSYPLFSETRESIRIVNYTFNVISYMNEKFLCTLTHPSYLITMSYHREFLFTE